MVVWHLGFSSPERFTEHCEEEAPRQRTNQEVTANERAKVAKRLRTASRKTSSPPVERVVVKARDET
jgi:hypothetical protein